jgi:hypothetical protein
VPLNAHYLESLAVPMRDVADHMARSHMPSLTNSTKKDVACLAKIEDLIRTPNSTLRF